MSENNVVQIAQSFNTMVDSLSGFKADADKQKGNVSKALESAINSFSLLHSTTQQKDATTGQTKIDNVNKLFGKEGLVGTISQLNSEPKTLNDFKTNVTSICNTFGETEGGTSLGKQVELLTAPLASLKKGIEKIPSFTDDNGNSLGEIMKQRLTSISDLAKSLEGFKFDDISITLPDISNLFNSIIETTVTTEDIKVKDWEEISKEEYDILQGGETILNAYGDVATKTDKFFKQVEKKTGTKNVTTYSSKLNTFTTNLLETTKALNPFKNAIMTFVKTDLSTTYKGPDIKATEDIYTYKLDENGERIKDKLLYKKGEVIASAVTQPVTKELIQNRVESINTLLGFIDELKFKDIANKKASIDALQTSLSTFTEHNKAKTTESQAIGLPLVGEQIVGVVKPFDSFRKSLVTFVKTNLAPTYPVGGEKYTEDEKDEEGNIIHKKGDWKTKPTDTPITKELIQNRVKSINTLLGFIDEFKFDDVNKKSADIKKLRGEISSFINENKVGSKNDKSTGLPLAGELIVSVVKPFDSFRKSLVKFVNGIDSATKDEYETNEIEVLDEGGKYVSEKRKDGWVTVKTERVEVKKKGKLSEDIPGLTGKITNFLNLLDTKTIKSMAEPVQKIKSSMQSVGIVVGQYSDGKTTKYAVVDAIDLFSNSMSKIMGALRKIPTKIKADSGQDREIGKIVKGANMTIHKFVKEAITLNTMTELDTLPYLVASLKLGESKVTESYYENSDKRRISVAEFDKLDKEQQKEYTYKTVSKDLSIVESIRLTSDFYSSVTKSIEKASSIPIHKALLAPIKIKLISNAITKSILSMIDVVNEINNIGNPKQIQDMLGWEDANNEYQIEGDSFVTEEYIDEDGKKQTRNKKNANYQKGHFEAESGIFKIGDYISSLVGTIDKLSNVSPLKILKTRIKISLTIKSIARTIRNILVAINSEMRDIDTSGVSKLMSSTIENVNNIVTESTDYTTNGNETVSELTKKVIDNSTTKTTTQGPFDVMITFFNIYENMMKIAEVGGLKLFFKSKKAKFRINALTKMLGQLVDEIDKNMKTKTKADVLAERVKSIAQVFNSMKSVVDSIEKTAGGSKGRKARRAIRRLNDIVDELVGGLNEETMVYKYGLIDALIKLTRKYERSGLQGKANVFKDMQTSFTDLSKMMAALAIIAPMSMIATVGLPTTFTVLFSVAGRKGVREKDGSIIGLMGRLSEKWEAYNKTSKSGIGKTLLMITGSLSLFIISLILAGKYAKEAFGGVLVISGVLALTLGIFWLISKINKGGVIKDGPIDRGGKTLLLISGSLLAFTLGLAVLSLVVTENQAALWHGVLQLSLMISTSALLMFVVSKMTGSVIKGALVMLVIAGSWMLFAHTLQKISDAASSVSLKTLIVTVSALTLMIGGVAAIGAILSVPLAGAIALAIIGSGVAVMTLVSGGFLMLAETMIKINEVFSTSSPNQVKENLKTMMDCLTDMVSHTKGMDKIERSQKRNMKRLSSITSSIGEMADVLRDIADFKIGIIDPNTGKITGYRNIEAADFQRAGDNAVMIVTKIEEIAKILSDENNSISRTDAKKAKKQAKRLNRISRITGPIQSAIELIQTIASGKITYTDETGKEVTKDLKSFFDENSANVQDTLSSLISGIDTMFKGINVTEGKGIDEDTSNAMTARIEAMTGLLDTLGSSVNPSQMKNVTSLQDNTSKIVSTINSLNVDKADKLKDVLKDLKEFNSEVGDIFEKMEETMENLVDQLKKMNGMKTKSSETRQSPSAPASNAMTAKPVNLSNIEGDIDELLNELRGIKSILMR